MRVIDDDGKNLDVMPIARALELASEKGLDVVEVSPNVSPPVVRIMDYGKYKYEQKKRAHKAKGHMRVLSLKEIRLHLKTEEHDLDIKAKKLREMLEELHKVQVTIILHGREMRHIDLAYANLKRLWERAQDLGKIEKEPTAEGNRIVMVIAPKPELIKQKEGKTKETGVDKEDKECKEDIDAEVKGEGFVS